MTEQDAGGARDHGSVLITNAVPYGEGDPVDVRTVNGVIAEIGPAGSVRDPGDGTDVLDAAGGVLLPGFVDLHTHLREPGREDAETVRSGATAAALGGYTAVFAMANTDPVADNALVTEHVWRAGRQVGLVDVHPVGAVTVGLDGAKLAELGTMADSAAAVRIFSDDGRCVDDPLIMRRALEYSRALDAVIAQHAEEPRLTAGAQAHEGERAARLGLTGWPSSAEESIVARDCILAAHAGARLHVCHVSTEGTTDVLRWAKPRHPGGPAAISAEVTPHHLLLTDERLTGYDPVNKVNPPLRTSSDAEALAGALAEGVIDCVATDHAPHAVQDKDTEWAAARPGMLGLQTALSVVVRTMLRPGLLDWRGVARVMSERPAEIARLPDQGRPIEVGEPANLAVVDQDAEWTVRGAELASIASNTPYEGMRLPARVRATVLRGRVTARDTATSPTEG
ncbi:dihydroorotase [Haloechinothrix sp. YIM 98757]|uniref:Dihydroorotase n=1 Tax=Haloechinothrix aidingensis TaxID=2752311 RepID=A0A838AA82_9PSEU|nr:dihydroorotase [Haloechinothrix aidingensis]